MRHQRTSLTERPCEKQPATSPPASRLFQSLRKYMPWPGRTTSRHSPKAELERLALSSPHLLPDLGFQRDVRAGTPDRTIWRKGRVVVSVGRVPDVATARVELHSGS